MEMQITDTGVSGYMHGEAFALMLYECKVCGGREVLYNTRDGVTPFGVPCRNEACNEHEMGSPMLHVNWKQDKCLPAFTPWPGMRVFRDGTLEEARAIMRRRIEACKGTEYERTPEETDAIVNAVTLDGNSGFRRGWPMIDLVGAKESK